MKIADFLGLLFYATILFSSLVHALLSAKELLRMRRRLRLIDNAEHLFEFLQIRNSRVFIYTFLSLTLLLILLAVDTALILGSVKFDKRLEVVCSFLFGKDFENSPLLRLGIVGLYCIAFLIWGMLEISRIKSQIQIMWVFRKELKLTNIAASDTDLNQESKR